MAQPCRGEGGVNLRKIETMVQKMTKVKKKESRSKRKDKKVVAGCNQGGKPQGSRLFQKELYQFRIGWLRLTTLMPNFNNFILMAKTVFWTKAQLLPVFNILDINN